MATVLWMWNDVVCLQLEQLQHFLHIRHDLLSTNVMTLDDRIFAIWDFSASALQLEEPAVFVILVWPS